MSGMSIATRTGDDGTTGLMYNRRLPKNHPRVEAYGAVDELNAALGLARCEAEDAFVAGTLLQVQQDLVTLMGELATASDDLPRYADGGFTLIAEEHVARLDAVVNEVESQNVTFDGWATPGANRLSAALDLARTTCRRAERRVCDLKSQGETVNEQIGIFLNRLSDALWLLARFAETRSTV
jgi:cob(I)alamin adenosyltransferase